MKTSPFALVAAAMALAGGSRTFGIDWASGPDRTVYVRRPRPSRYRDDAKHRKAVDGNRANVRRMQRERLK